MKLLILFFTGAVQVGLVSANTILLASGNVLGVVFVSYLISFVWTFNVKKVAFGGMTDRVVYSLGAATGAVAGLCCATALGARNRG